MQVDRSPTQQPTQVELQALHKLRENLNTGATEKPLRAFTCMRDIFIDTPDGAASTCICHPAVLPLNRIHFWC